MPKFEKGTVQGYKGMQVPFEFIKTEEGTNSLAILLPGAGYTTSSPLFHYSTEAFLNRSVDVLEVNYQYNNEAYDEFSMEELSEAIKHDVKTVLDQEIEGSSYEHFYLIGKSLGTIAMSTELQRPAFRDAKAVWLTPLFQRDDVFQAMLHSPNEGLCFIGDADRCYIKDRYEQIENKPNISAKLFSNVDHSLDSRDGVMESIGALECVINEIRKF
ncbi:alpha/beta hydrolase [Planomicrobium sp. CPCC 101079]|uniref:alpha/beta family hydrolase n=1 Tax=Planomicrobium sp. CPCC 101079 TaxID=2599618 RepID=UPI0011B78313|nr:alpha/beta hydrolase [Planomicrobium sp. CPCC 101079]TWT00490.1 alpha/beta hydrolase [Planomicrobium sp. CPCC 101079]